jgi:hypothetical protein
MIAQLPKDQEKKKNEKSSTSLQAWCVNWMKWCMPNSWFLYIDMVTNKVRVIKFQRQQRITNQQVTLKGTATEAKRSHILLGTPAFIYINNLKRHHNPRQKLLYTYTKLHSTSNRSLRINKSPVKPKMPAIKLNKKIFIPHH